MTCQTPTAPPPAWWPSWRAIAITHSKLSRLDRLREAMRWERTLGLTAALCRD